jgi:hypothetical protein
MWWRGSGDAVAWLSAHTFGHDVEPVAERRRRRRGVDKEAIQFGDTNPE